MANSCESCGYKNSEVRPGGGISPKGCSITLKVVDRVDLNRDIIKSDSASVEIPSLELIAGSGVAMITTVEGLVTRITDDLRK